MSAEAFANTIISKLRSNVGTDGGGYTNSTPKLAQRAISEAITEYLIANTTVTAVYQGTLNSGGIDPINLDNFSLTGVCTSPIAPPSFTFWQRSLQNSIASSFSLESPNKSGIITNIFPIAPSGLTIYQNKLKSIVENNKQNPLELVWQSFCTDILAWLNSSSALRQIPPQPASHGTISTGTLSPISIKVL